MFDTVGIVGLGLIGASIAIDVRKRNLAKTIIGFDSDEKALNRALDEGVIDAYGELKSASVCDFVVVATPVYSIPGIVKKLLGIMKPHSIVMDVGSVKGAIIERLEGDLGGNVYYIPVHPIAGIEKFGFSAAMADLFENAYCIITPYDGMNRFAAKRVEAFVEALGMRVEIMDAKEHDMVFGYISHLPHLIAYALVALIEKKHNEKFKFIGGGFRDFTRIAASSERMWSEIFLMNSDELLKTTKEYKQHIEKLEKLIEADDLEGLTEYLKAARLFKESLG